MVLMASKASNVQIGSQTFYVLETSFKKVFALSSLQKLKDASEFLNRLFPEDFDKNGWGSWGLVMYSCHEIMP